jgi:DNA repair exonuclease SbcCD ATPase subunit
MEKIEILEIETGQSEQTLKELKEEVKSLRQELDGCTIGSDKFKSTLEELSQAQTKLKNATKGTNDALEGSYDALTQKMADLRKQWKATADEAERADLGQQIADINNQLKDMDASIGNYQRNVGNYASAFDDVTLKIEGGVAKFERFNNISRSVIGSFDLVEGGLKAIGVESEEVEGLMNSMQGAMMLTNGLNSIKEGVQAFTALRTTIQTATVAQSGLNAMMMANPIGAVVAVVAALTAGVTALVKVIRKNRDEEEQLKTAYEATNRVIADRINSQELEIQLMEARGEAQADILQQELEYAKINAETTKNRIAAIEKELEQTGTLRIKKKKLLKEQLEDLKDQLKDQEEAVRDANNAILVFDVRTRKEQTDAAREAAEEQKKIAKDKADKEIEEARRAQEEINKTYQQRKEEREEYWLNELQLKAKRLEEWVEEEKNIVRKQHENGLISEQEYLDQIFEIDKIHWDKKRKLEEEAAKASEEYFTNSADTATVTAEKTAEATQKVTWSTMEASEKYQAMAGLAGTAFGQTAQLLNTLSQQQDKTTKEGFEASKKMSIAAATMSMLQGIISSWTSAMSLPAPISFITGGLMTAFTTSLGIAQINSIKKQSFDGGESGASTATAMPSVNTAALISSPINYTTEVKGAQAEEGVAQRVYVVESDITNTQSKVKTVQDESTY